MEQLVSLINNTSGYGFRWLGIGFMLFGTICEGFCAVHSIWFWIRGQKVGNASKLSAFAFLPTAIFTWLLTSATIQTHHLNKVEIAQLESELNKEHYRIYEGKSNFKGCPQFIVNPKKITKNKIQGGLAITQRNEDDNSYTTYNNVQTYDGDYHRISVNEAVKEMKNSLWNGLD